MPRVPVKIQTWDLHHRKERRKSLELPSRIIHLMDLGQRDLGSKGVQAHRQEDRGLGSLASPGDREESASHHRKPCCQILMLRFIILKNQIKGLEENDSHHIDVSQFCALFEKLSDVSIRAVKIQTWGCYHRKEHKKCCKMIPGTSKTSPIQPRSRHLKF